MVLTKIKHFFELVKIEHTVFALPFAYLGAVIGSGGFPFFREVLWITLAMFGARSFGMAWNRIVDRRIDAKNPRTAGRHLVTGKVTLAEALGFCLFSLLVFITAAYRLSPLAHLLWPLFILPMVIYPFTKRFSWLSHFVLGLCLALAPMGAYMSVTNRPPDLSICLLFAGVLIWTAGFDIIYACQDYEFDRKEALYSIPVRFGVNRSFDISSILHFTTVLLFLLAGFLLKLGTFYFLGIGLIAVFLFYENFIVKTKGKSCLNSAFFKMNAMVSITIFLFTLMDYYL